MRHTRKSSRQRVALRGRKPREKRPEHVMTFIHGQRIYESMYHEDCSSVFDILFAVNESIRGVPTVELNLFLRKERFEDLQSRISNYEPDPQTLCCIATSNGMNWSFWGYPILTACKEDVQDGFKGILVTLRCPVTDIKCF